RPLVGDLEVRLLGTHVIGFAGDDFAFLVYKEASGLGDSEIGQLHVTLESDHDILEANIPVDNPQVFAVAVGFGVRVSESSSDAAGDKNGQFLGQYPAFLLQLLSELLQIYAAD